MSYPPATSPEGLDDGELAAYLKRIGLVTQPTVDAIGLTALQRAQRHSIPFENLDIPLGRGISLDPGAIFAKLVTARRGGYCFEQNALFLRALVTLGFTVRPLLGRVWLRTHEVPSRTHTLNLITLEGDEWIADAGFGASDAPPMPLTEHEAVVDDLVRHRLDCDSAHGWMLRRNGEPQYSFTKDYVWPADLAQANHWTATAPESRFVRQCIVSLLTPRGLSALTSTRFSQDGTEMNITTVAAYRAALEHRFGIELSDQEVASLNLFES
jgi:N-hydroxyarylamine O-acetyltransferase